MTIQGWQVDDKRVTRLMRTESLYAASPRQGTVSTDAVIVRQSRSDRPQRPLGGIQRVSIALRHAPRQ